jgi:hypothetical protein
MKSPTICPDTVTSSTHLLFDEGDYNTLKERYLTPQIRENPELANGMMLRRQYRDRIIDKKTKGFKKLKQTIDSLLKKNKHEEVYKLLYQLREWEMQPKRNGIWRELGIFGDEDEVQELVDLTHDNHIHCVDVEQEDDKVNAEIVLSTDQELAVTEQNDNTVGQPQDSDESNVDLQVPKSSASPTVIDSNEQLANTNHELNVQSQATKFSLAEPAPTISNAKTESYNASKSSIVQQSHISNEFEIKPDHIDSITSSKNIDIPKATHSISNGNIESLCSAEDGSQGGCSTTAKSSECKDIGVQPDHVHSAEAIKPELVFNEPVKPDHTEIIPGKCSSKPMDEGVEIPSNLPVTIKVTCKAMRCIKNSFSQEASSLLKSDYNELKQQYLTPLVRDKSQLANGMTLRKQCIGRLIDTPTPRFKKLKQKLDLLTKKNRHEEVHKILCQLRNWRNDPSRDEVWRELGETNSEEHVDLTNDDEDTACVDTDNEIKVERDGGELVCNTTQGDSSQSLDEDAKIHSDNHGSEKDQDTEHAIQEAKPEHHDKHGIEPQTVEFCKLQSGVTSGVHAAVKKGHDFATRCSTFHDGQSTKLKPTNEESTKIITTQAGCNAISANTKSHAFICNEQISLKPKHETMGCCYATLTKDEKDNETKCKVVVSADEQSHNNSISTESSNVSLAPALFKIEVKTNHDESDISLEPCNRRNNDHQVSISRKKPKGFDLQLLAIAAQAYGKDKKNPFTRQPTACSSTRDDLADDWRTQGKRRRKGEWTPSGHLNGKWKGKEL